MPVNDKTSRVALLLAAFLSGLVLFFGAIQLWSGRRQVLAGDCRNRAA